MAGVAMAVADCVEDGTIPADEADDLFISCGKPVSFKFTVNQFKDKTEKSHSKANLTAKYS